MSVGMGRGRGRLPQQLNGDVEPLRRPNMASVGRGRPSQVVGATGPTRSKFTDIESALSDFRVDSMVLFKALDEFLQNSPTNEEIENLLKKIFEKTLSSKTNSDCICKCIYLASKHKSYGNQLYLSFFSKLEEKFMGSDSIRECEGSAAMWRFQLFFSSVCQFVRNQKAAPMVELIDGLKKLCLESAQPSNSEEAKISAIAIARCVYFMKLSNKSATQVDILLSKLRGLIHGSCSAASSDPNMMLWFALGLETACLASFKLPDETVQYYCRLLGPEAAMFNLVPQPAVNLLKQCQSNYNFADISYVLNFT